MFWPIILLTEITNQWATLYFSGESNYGSIYYHIKFYLLRYNGLRI